MRHVAEASHLTNRSATFTRAMRTLVQATRVRYLFAFSLLAELLLTNAHRASAQVAGGPLIGAGYRPATAVNPRVAARIPDTPATHGLHFSQAQVDQILAIDARYEPELLALIADHPRSATQAYREAHNARFRAWKARRAAEVRAVLTPIQRTRFDANLRNVAVMRAARVTSTMRH